MSPAVKKPIEKILLVEDNPGDARLLREMLDEQQSFDIDLIHVGGVGEAEAYLAKNPADIILLDLGLPDAVGLEGVRRIRAAAPRVALVVLTGLDDETQAGLALQEGAQDYLIKGQIEVRGLFRALRYAIERNLMDEALFVEKERAEVTLNSIGDAVICTDIAGNITFLNVGAEKMTGWSMTEAAGRPLAEVFRVLDGGSGVTPPAAEQPDDGAMRLPENSILIRRGGVIIPVEHCVSPIHDREGKMAGTVIVFRDASAARAIARQMIHSAQHDFLTGLPNRMLLNDRIGQAIALAKRHGNHVAVLFLDLDRFKGVNDSLGHMAGDKLLQSIARRLVDSVRASDTVCRQGGDEFVVLLSEVKHADDAAHAAQRILDAVAEVHTIAQHRLNITTSIGVSVFPVDGEDAEQLIKNADTAMYQAKEKGRLNFQFFVPGTAIEGQQRANSAHA
jgi:diguanylate cyclase (GGDEF)-like protein/PAS domain S-box-containing protein